MIYCDDVHLIGETIEELHAFALKIGVKRCWFENKRGKKHPHYDLTNPAKVKAAYAAGAIRVSGKELVNIIKQIYK